MIIINAVRDSYSPEECSNTLTVGELIDELSNFDTDEKVVLSFDNGYTYGSITSERIDV